jgi:hypothetical protein
MPSLGLSLSSDSSATNLIQYILGFPTRIKITSADLSFTDNLLKINDDANSVSYEGSDSTLIFGKNNTANYGEITLTSENISINYPSWTTGATSLPRTGWAEGYVVSEASTLSLTITSSTPQTFTYNASNPAIAFSNDRGLASNFFSFSPALSASSGTRTTTLSLNPNADYLATNSFVVSHTINKKNVTIALTSQSSTYAPNQSYSEATPVAITSLSGADTISASFTSLLTGVPAQGSNAGSYTIALNPSYSSTNYNITNSPASVTWTISQANQTITFNPTLTGLNGETQSLSASSTSGLSVALSVVSGPATLAGSTLTYTGTGNVVVRASQAGNTNYNVATNVDKTIVVSASGGGVIPVSATTFSISGGNAGYPTITVSKLTGNTDVYPCYFNQGSSDPTTKYTFNHLWYNNSATNFYEAHIGVATRKKVNGSQSGFISGSNCGYEVTEAVSPTWVLFSLSSDEYGPNIITLATNPSQDFNNVPTTGWVTHYGLSSVTITA